MLTPQEKAKFVLQLHKQSLQAFDSGGTVLEAPSSQGAVQNAVNPNSGFTGSIGGFLGLNNQFQANGANLQQGTNAAQLNQAYTGAQQGIGAQQQFANEAVGANGFQNQANTFNQQQLLARQLQAQAQGQGPNPAQAALNQNTAQNIQNQAALMASQRGASANPALIARQAAQQGAATQQQAVGQGATLQAQQQLAAQSALANQQAQMQGVAANQIAAQGQGANALSSGQQNEQNILQGANTGYNNAAVSQQGNINNVNAATAAGNQNENNKVFGGITQAASNIPIIGSFLAKGGMVQKMANGGVMAPALSAPQGAPQSFVGQFLNSSVQGSSAPSIAAPQLPQMNDDPLIQKKAKSSTPSAPTGMGISDLGSTDLMGGAGAGTSGAADAAAVAALAAQGGMIKKELAAKGGKVKAQSLKEKAVKKDNSYANDKIPALLSQNEIVLPRSITMHPNAPALAAKFVAQTIAHRKIKGGLK